MKINYVILNDFLKFFAKSYVSKKLQLGIKEWFTRIRINKTAKKNFEFQKSNI